MATTFRAGLPVRGAARLSLRCGPALGTGARAGSSGTMLNVIDQLDMGKGSRRIKLGDLVRPRRQSLGSGRPRIGSYLSRDIEVEDRRSEDCWGAPRVRVRLRITAQSCCSKIDPRSRPMTRAACCADAGSLEANHYSGVRQRRRVARIGRLLPSGLSKYSDDFRPPGARRLQWIETRRRLVKKKTESERRPPAFPCGNRAGEKQSAGLYISSGGSRRRRLS